MNKKQLSKFLSLILRHKPETIGVKPDRYGWIAIDELVDKIQKNGQKITYSEIEDIVLNSDKKRFSFNNDKTKIKANYGHSIPVEVESLPEPPPEHLYHGTVARKFYSIKEHGLTSQNRQFVHLSKDRKTALEVGSRHGEPTILEIEALKMHQSGYKFFRTPSAIWLTEFVPAKYILFPQK